MAPPLSSPRTRKIWSAVRCWISWARAIQVGERLPGGQGGRHRGEHDVAGLRLRAGEDRLRDDLRPGRVAFGLAQVNTAQAGRTSGPDQRPDDTDGLAGPDG